MSFQGYISYPISSEPTDILNEAYTYLKSKAPSWVENDGNLDVWILQVAASQASDLNTIAADVSDTIFKWFGANLMGVPPLDATGSVVGSTWTVQDTAGYTIPAGTMVAVTDAVGASHGFQTISDVIIPAGSSATSAGFVSLYSTETGAITAGLGGSGYVATLVDTLAFVTSVTLTGPSTGGQDAELSSVYNDRLARKLQRLSQRPVLASDFSLAALDVTGVQRTVALDGYNPTAGTMNNERYVGIAGVDAAGVPLSAGVKSSLQTYLDGQRETNFVVQVFDPSVSVIDVTFTVQAIVGYTIATVQANAIAAVETYLDPKNWGTDPSITDASAQAETWVETNMLYWSKLMQVIGVAQGVNRVETLTMAIHPAALGTADITLPGHACLTNVGTITGTAVP